MARKQEALPGVAGKKIKELSEAMEAYEEIKNTRIALSNKEIEANEKVVELMHKHKVKVYRDDDYEPSLIGELAAKDPTIKAKVYREKPAKGEE